MSHLYATFFFDTATPFHIYIYWQKTWTMALDHLSRCLPLCPMETGTNQTGYVWMWVSALLFSWVAVRVPHSQCSCCLGQNSFAHWDGERRGPTASHVSGDHPSYSQSIAKSLQLGSPGCWRSHFGSSFPWTGYKGLRMWVVKIEAWCFIRAAFCFLIGYLLIMSLKKLPWSSTVAKKK